MDFIPEMLSLFLFIFYRFVHSTESMAIVCDRDFNDIGNPWRGSFETHFIYYKKYNPSTLPGSWQRGLYIPLKSDSRGFKISNLLKSHLEHANNKEVKEAYMNILHIHKKNQVIYITNNSV